MSIVTSAIVDAPLDEVFAWHERPGAVHRLTPPWQPVRVRAEARSLRDGQAELSIPPGLRWVASHRAEEYRPQRRFVDELTSVPLRRVVPWRHVHEFEPVGEATRVTDRVDTVVPESVLRPMFDYRQRQLADDLTAHRWVARRFGRGSSTIAVTGSSGLVGTALVAFLSTGGHRVIRLVRHQPQADDERHWDPARPDPDLLTGVDAVVHLAGANIMGRLSERHRRALRDSRLGPTRRLAELAAATPGVECLVTASAIGYYGPDRGEEFLTESSSHGQGFLAGMVGEWERASAPARAGGVRVVQVRTGVVLSPRGGPLQLLYPLFFAGLGGKLAPGRQWLSWISLDDLLDIYLRALADRELHGPVNAVAPEPVRNAEFAATLARVLRRPAVFTAPEFATRLALGARGSRELAQTDQRAVPHRLHHRGHLFRHPDVDSALRHMLGRSPDRRRPAVH